MIQIVRKKENMLFCDVCGKLISTTRSYYPATKYFIYHPNPKNKKKIIGVCDACYRILADKYNKSPNVLFKISLCNSCKEKFISGAQYLSLSNQLHLQVLKRENIQDLERSPSTTLCSYCYFNKRLCKICGHYFTPKFKGQFFCENCVPLECKFCGKEIENEDDFQTLVANSYICSDCFSKYFTTCQHCGQVILKSKAKTITLGENQINLCLPCFHNNYFFCHFCKKFHEISESRMIENKRVCSDCYSKFPKCEMCSRVILKTYKFNEMKVCKECYDYAKRYAKDKILSKPYSRFNSTQSASEYKLVMFFTTNTSSWI